MSMIITNREPDDEVTAYEAAQVAQLPGLLLEEKRFQQDIDTHPYNELTRVDIIRLHDAGDKEATRLIALHRVIECISDAIDHTNYATYQAAEDSGAKRFGRS
ncbi:MAG: hypothetical protein WA741_12605 [Candidatus Sulfotelmatobacter sp.]